jgi:mannose-1-phosphate guanylyltransferase/mannose-1-phosphate guanylyltransferase/mannose-6-phosphate isomerase
VQDLDGFLAAVDAGAPAAREGALVLFGIEPDRPATGYGYIRVGQVRTGGAHAVEQFVEKPDRATAEAYLASGEYRWNSGIFLMPAAVVVRELETLEPAVLAAVREAIDRARADLEFLRLDEQAFRRAPSLSIDHALLERTTAAAMIPADFAWADVGSWSSLLELAEVDAGGNAQIGDVLLQDTRNSYVRSESPLVATVGVEDLIIVATRDAVLVAHKSADQEVKTLVDRLKLTNHRAAIQNRKVYRPWGWYEELHDGDRFQVKRITVRPGGVLSLQKHFHRAEHWVVVNGTAQVHVDGEERLLSENESLYIPLGSPHRLSNPGKVALNLIEVQSGAYLGEDDIVRLDDIYARK